MKVLFFLFLALALPSQALASGAYVVTVQAEINQALGVSPALNDLNADGIVNAVDVEAAINQALGVSAASVTVSSGSPQSTAIGTAFGAPLVALVQASGGNPVSGVTVTFSAPGSGPSATFAGGVNTATTDANGLATSAALTANSTAGSYNVIATAPGASTSATFALTNTAGAPSSSVTLSPASATIQQTAFATFSAAVNGSSASSFSYLWGTSGNAGTLSAGQQSGQTSFCSASAQVTYTPNPTPALSTTVTDTLSVQAFSGLGCGSGSNVAAGAGRVTVILPVSATSLPGFPTTTYAATVVLPSGSTLTPDSLNVLDSLTQVTPTSSGTFVLPSYDNGGQIVFVESPDGTAMMMGWMDANHPNVSASTTAEVLAYYALGGSQMLTETDRNNVIAQIPQLAAFPALAQAVASALAANPDAFAQANPGVTAALNSLFTSVTGVTPQARLPGVKPNDVLGNPDGSTPQSGVTLSSTEPDGYSTDAAITPFSTFLTNAYRRRTHAFVLRLQDTVTGQPPTPDPDAVKDFDIPPVTGVNGGVTGALVDIVKAYFGNQATAYAPATVDPPLELPVTYGYDSTTYQVINVGPGGTAQSPPIALTDAQRAIWITTCVNGIVNDAIVPFVTNVFFGSGEFQDNSNVALTGSFRSSFVLAAEKNIAALVSGLAATQDKVVSGDWKGALGDLLFNAGGLPAVTDQIKAALISATGSPTFGPTTVNSVLEDFDSIMYAAGAGLQIFDSVVYLNQITGSHTADQWMVTSTQPKATLTPTATLIHGLSSVPLTANVPNVNNTTVFSYRWVLAPAAGQSLVGTLTENGGAGRTNQTNFCSSSASVTYINSSSAVAALTQPATDTISMTVFNTPSGCTPSQQLTTTVSAIVTTDPKPGVTVTPLNSMINPGDTVALAATYSDMKVTVGSWRWNLAAATTGSSTTGGTLTGAGGTNSFCSTSPNATYTSTTTAPLAGSVTDVVQVTAFQQPGCNPPSNPQLGNIAVAVIQTASGFRLRVNKPTLMKPGDQVNLSAAFRLGLANPPTPGSYRWTNTANYGSLASPGTPAGTSYCSTSNLAVYTATATNVAKPVSDVVTAIPFADAHCTSSQVDGLTGSATMTTEPPPAPFVTPGTITSVLQSGDGNFYAAASQTGCGASGMDLCNYILQITPAGTVTVLHTFEFDTSTANPSGVNDDGIILTGLIEGSDGALYGTASAGGDAGNGTAFKMTKDGTFTLLWNFDDIVVVSTSSGIPRGGHINCSDVVTSVQYGVLTGYKPGPLVQGADGNFYGTAQGGVAYGTVASGTFFLLSPAGGAEALRTYTYDYFIETGSGNTDTCGEPIVTTSAVYVDPVYFGFGTSPSLTQGADGSFYGQMTGPNSSNPGDIFKLDPDGGPTVLHALATDGSEGAPVNHAPVGGPSGLMYGVTTNGLYATNLYGNFQLLQPSAPITTAPFILGSDGNFYGSTGGSTNSGELFQLTPNGAQMNVTNVTTPSDFTSPNVPATPVSVPIEIAGGNLVGGAQFSDTTQNPVAITNFLFNMPTQVGLAGSIQLSFPGPAAPVNQPVTLSWQVANAFSLTAQQCHATVQGNAPGAGVWTGPQAGAMNGNLYTGTVAIVPTAPGTYTYALTCGGTESGFATLTVQ